MGYYVGTWYYVRDNGEDAAGPFTSSGAAHAAQRALGRGTVTLYVATQHGIDLEETTEMTLLEALEASGYTAKISRKRTGLHGMWRITVYRGRTVLAVFEARELRAACALAVGSRLPTGTV